MNQKDWKDAMHNEAEAVNDVQWAQETEQAAQLFGWRVQWSGFLVALGSTGVMSGLVLVLGVLRTRVATGMDQNLIGSLIDTYNAGYVAICLTLLFAVAFLLGRNHVTPSISALALAMFPWLGYGLSTLITLPGHTIYGTPQSTYDLATMSLSSSMLFESAFIAGLASAGAVLGQRSTRRAHLA
ncbi:hypothetical protein ACFFLM_11560 [Deinococcus oregonensis]|uniref:Uncharacterized protein n=1 Tax=Deinococcus oregonensis TaxID=1805970 RepID=A0ABV6AYM1_9DEIO